jgi:hypothetical protein
MEGYPTNHVIISVMPDKYVAVREWKCRMKLSTIFYFRAADALPEGE